MSLEQNEKKSKKNFDNYLSTFFQDLPPLYPLWYFQNKTKNPHVFYPLDSFDLQKKDHANFFSSTAILSVFYWKPVGPCCCRPSWWLMSWHRTIICGPISRFYLINFTINVNYFKKLILWKVSLTVRKNRLPCQKV